ncbi:hypothetical protein AB0M35_13690 [Micromonospora sp. NPDC051196]|uniref:hypothetical protein n=1 Tax=Micromonospora sp. NPDC051196 TaxID=3155281 RepID=UPI00341F95BA
MLLRRVSAAVATGTLVALTLAVPSANASTLNAGATPKAGNTAVKIRTGAGTGYTAVAQINTGQWVSCWYPVTSDCNKTTTGVTTGGSYTCNGATSNKWLKVGYQLTLRYVALGCVNTSQMPPGAGIG